MQADVDIASDPANERASERSGERSGERAGGYTPATPTRAAWVWRFLMLAVMVLVVAATVAWFSRERIAANLIDSALTDAGLEASYDIVSIGTTRQTIANLVIGDPQAPDFTAERVNADISYSLGVPRIGRIQLIRPRLFGAFRDGGLSLGSLDPLLYAERDAPPGLPTVNLAIFDGRARIASDYGRVGIKLDGSGPLDDGFAGVLAATAPGIDIAGCGAERTTVYGRLSTSEGEVGFDGPVRIGNTDCRGAAIQAADIAAKLTLSRDFSAVTADFDILAQNLTQGDLTLSELTGTADVAWAFAGELSVRHDLKGKGFSSPYGRVQTLGADGTLRSTGGLEKAQWDADFNGQGVAIDQKALAFTEARAAVERMFAESLLTKMENGLSRALADSEAVASMVVRRDEGEVRAIMPEARIRSAGGDTILSLSRVNYSGATQDRPRRLTGNVMTGGAGLPRINARIEQDGADGIAMRATMAEYREGGDAIAIPRLQLRRDHRDAITFNAMVKAAGSIPGGEISGLTLPIEGSWSKDNGLAVGRRCTAVEIAGLRVSELSLKGHAVSLCPVEGGAMVTSKDGLRIAARTDDLEFLGKLAETPTRIAADSAVFRYPGPFRIKAIDAVIGPQDNAVRLTANNLEGALDNGPGGRFDGATAAIDAVPLDLSDLTGNWTYAEGVLRIGEGGFTLTERTDPANGPYARFQPLQAGAGATLILEENFIRADAGLRHPASQTLVAEVGIRHDLMTGRGRADFTVPGVRFREGFQPADLSLLTKGVVAFADGRIDGSGEIVWDGDSIDSSGTFATDDFNFAAAFGPVREVSGTVTFTDLLALTTAPSQELRIGSINTGVEVFDGRIIYSVKDGTQITVEDGRWPFMGGELMLRPVTLDYGGEAGQSYVFEIVGLDAATFVAQMELTNLGATGTFDGTIPIIFDARGNGTIAGGVLVSRAPGGNVAYVGELSYEDLGTMGNYAFKTLRSLDYNQMLIELDGNLAGEIVTRFKIDGVRQGAGTSRNFITRELARLPIRFDINVRSDNFYLLATIVRGLFDPTVFGNPVDQGLFDVEDGEFTPTNRLTDPDPDPDRTPNPADKPAKTQRRDESAVQPSESDYLP